MPRDLCCHVLQLQQSQEMVAHNTRETEARDGIELEAKLNHIMRSRPSWTIWQALIKGRRRGEERRGGRRRGRGREKRGNRKTRKVWWAGSLQVHLIELEEKMCRNSNCPPGKPLWAWWPAADWALAEAASGFDPGAHVPKFCLQPGNLHLWNWWTLTPLTGKALVCPNCSHLTTYTLSSHGGHTDSTLRPFLHTDFCNLVFQPPVTNWVFGGTTLSCLIGICVLTQHKYTQLWGWLFSDACLCTACSVQVESTDAETCFSNHNNETMLVSLETEQSQNPANIRWGPYLQKPASQDSGLVLPKGCAASRVWVYREGRLNLGAVKEMYQKKPRSC